MLIFRYNLKAKIMKNSNAKISKTLVEYYILAESAKNVKSLHIIGNLQNEYKISRKVIYNVIEEMLKKGTYKVIDETLKL